MDSTVHTKLSATLVQCIQSGKDDDFCISDRGRSVFRKIHFDTLDEGFFTFAVWEVLNEFIAFFVIGL